MEYQINNKFETKEQYNNFISTWKEEFKKARKLERNEYGNKIRQFTDIDFFFYALMKGKDPRKCYHNEDRYIEAKREIRWYFDGRSDRFEHRFGKFLTEGGLDYNTAMQPWHKFEEVA